MRPSRSTEAFTRRSASAGESVRGTVRGRLGPAIAAAGLSARVPMRVRWRRYARTAASRLAIVAGARPSARIVASQVSISSVVAAPTGWSIVVANDARSRRYASTVRGERRAARRSRKLSTSGSWRSLIAAGPDSAASPVLLRSEVRKRRLRARVRVVVDAPQPPCVDVAVDLRRRERGVAEELLDRPKIDAAFEEVRGVRVAQPVRVGEEPTQDARVEPAAAHGEEERIA